MAKKLLIATRKGLFTATINARGFSVAGPDFAGVPVSMVLADPRDGSRYAALDHGHFGTKLHRHDGKRWREVAVPVYPQLPKMRGKRGQKKDADHSLRLIWSLEIDPRAPGALWCGTIPGGLFHSADAGSSWQLVDGLWNVKARKKWNGGGYDMPGIHSICVDPRDPACVTVGVSSGGVWRTADGGRRWRNVATGMRAAYMPKKLQFDPDIQDPHRLAMCAADPDRIWCQHHNGIFRTQTPGKPWREIKAKAPSRFGFACAVHPRDPRTAWFVPAVKDECRMAVDGKLVVLRTTDAGRSFTELRRGLPQRHAYDLVYRHGLEVAADGKTLAMGSTSGRVWASPDGGDRWRELPANLPPVYAVRWID